MVASSKRRHPAALKHPALTDVHGPALQFQVSVGSVVVGAIVGAVGAMVGRSVGWVVARAAVGLVGRDGEVDGEAVRGAVQPW